MWADSAASPAGSPYPSDAASPSPTPGEGLAMLHNTCPTYFTFTGFLQSMLPAEAPCLYANHPKVSQPRPAGSPMPWWASPSPQPDNSSSGAAPSPTPGNPEAPTRLLHSHSACRHAKSSAAPWMNAPHIWSFCRLAMALGSPLAGARQLLRAFAHAQCV